MEIGWAPQQEQEQEEVRWEVGRKQDRSLGSHSQEQGAGQLIKWSSPLSAENPERRPLLKSEDLNMLIPPLFSLRRNK